MLKDVDHWTIEQITQMHWLQRSGLKTARAWRLKQRLRDVFARCTDPAAASTLLVRWIRWATRCRLPPFKRLAGTMKKNPAGILEHFRSGLNNGFAEAINGRVQAAKARAKGYVPMPTCSPSVTSSAPSSSTCRRIRGIDLLYRRTAESQPHESRESRHSFCMSLRAVTQAVVQAQLCV